MAVASFAVLTTLATGKIKDNMLVFIIFGKMEFAIKSLLSPFLGGPGLAGTRMSPFWILLELRVMEVVVITGTIRRAKLQSSLVHQQTNTQFFYKPNALPVAEPMSKL